MPKDAQKTTLQTALAALLVLVREVQDSELEPKLAAQLDTLVSVFKAGGEIVEKNDELPELAALEALVNAPRILPADAPAPAEAAPAAQAPVAAEAPEVVADAVDDGGEAVEAAEAGDGIGAELDEIDAELGQMLAGAQPDDMPIEAELNRLRFTYTKLGAEATPLTEEQALAIHAITVRHLTDGSDIELEVVGTGEGAHAAQRYVATTVPGRTLPVTMAHYDFPGVGAVQIWIVDEAAVLGDVEPGDLEGALDALEGARRDAARAELGDLAEQLEGLGADILAEEAAGQANPPYLHMQFVAPDKDELTVAERENIANVAARFLALNPQMGQVEVVQQIASIMPNGFGAVFRVENAAILGLLKRAGGGVGGFNDTHFGFRVDARAVPIADLFELNELGQIANNHYDDVDGDDDYGYDG